MSQYPGEPRPQNGSWSAPQQGGAPGGPYQQGQPGGAPGYGPQSGGEQYGGQPYGVPQGAAPGTAPGPAGAPGSSGGASFQRVLARLDWQRAGLTAVAAYVAMLVMAILMIVVLTLGALGDFFTSSDSLQEVLRSSGGAGATVTTGNGSLFDDICLLLQMIPFALGSPLRIHVSDFDLALPVLPNDFTAVMVHGTPLMITGAGVFTLYFLAKQMTRRRLANGERLDSAGLWISSGMTAVMFTLFTLLISSLMMARTELSGFPASQITIHAVGWESVVFPLVFGTLICRWGGQVASSPRPSRVRNLTNRFAPGLAVGARLLVMGMVALMLLLSLVYGVHMAFDTGIAAGTLVFLFGPLLAVNGLAMGMFSGLIQGSAVDGELGQLLSGGRLSDEKEMLFLNDVPSDMIIIAVITVVAWILMVLWLSFAWAGRRPETTSPFSWAIMPALFLLTGLIMLWAGSASADVLILHGDPQFSVSVGPVWWTPLIMLLWGALVEVLARFAAPAIGRELPEGMRRRLMGEPERQLWTDAGAGAPQQPGPYQHPGQNPQSPAGPYPPSNGASPSGGGYHG